MQNILVVNNPSKTVTIKKFMDSRGVKAYKIVKDSEDLIRYLVLETSNIYVFDFMLDITVVNALVDLRDSVNNLFVFAPNDRIGIAYSNLTSKIFILPDEVPILQYMWDSSMMSLHNVLACKASNIPHCRVTVPDYNIKPTKIKVEYKPKKIKSQYYLSSGKLEKAKLEQLQIVVSAKGKKIQEDYNVRKQQQIFGDNMEQLDIPVLTNTDADYSTREVSEKKSFSLFNRTSKPKKPKLKKPKTVVKPKPVPVQIEEPEEEEIVALPLPQEAPVMIAVPEKSSLKKKSSLFKKKDATTSKPKKDNKVPEDEEIEEDVKANLSSTDNNRIIEESFGDFSSKKTYDNDEELKLIEESLEDTTSRESMQESVQESVQESIQEPTHDKNVLEEEDGEDTENKQGGKHEDKHEGKHEDKSSEEPVVESKLESKHEPEPKPKQKQLVTNKKHKIDLTQLNKTNNSSTEESEQVIVQPRIKKRSLSNLKATTFPTIEDYMLKNGVITNTEFSELMAELDTLNKQGAGIRFFDLILRKEILTDEEVIHLLAKINHIEIIRKNVLDSLEPDFSEFSIEHCKKLKFFQVKESSNNTDQVRLICSISSTTFDSTIRRIFDNPLILHTLDHYIMEKLSHY